MKWAASAVFALLAIPISAGSAPVPAHAPAAPSPPAPSSRPRPETGRYCAVAPVVIANSSRMRYAVYLAATDGNNVSGMLALYSGAIRYDVPFHDLVADDGRNSTKPTVIVVKFPAPVAIESAVVSALDTGNGNTHCSIPFAPWTVEAAQGTEPAPKRTMEWFRGAVAAAEIVAAPAPVNDPRPCATPDRAGRTVKAYEPETAENFTLKGDVVVVVTIDEKDHLIGAEILESSGSGDMDNIAVGAAMRSQFAGATFRCRPIVGEYRFVVSFGD